MHRTARLLCLASAAALLAACEREPVVETQPVPLNDFAFPYPEELWDAGVEGRTVLRIRVGPEGRVDSALVATPARDAAFDSAALAGAGGLRFEPARRDGTPVARWVLLPVEFDITAPQPAAPAAPPAPQ